MKNKSFAIACLMFLFLLSGCANNVPKTYDDTIPITEFMLGKWRATQQVSNLYESYQEKDFVKFGRNGSLKYCNKNPLEPFCANFSYSQIKDDLFQVKNQRLSDGNWWINRNGEKLTVCIWNKENCLEFIRDTSGYNIFLELFGMYW